jgi:hypothetical protein
MQRLCRNERQAQIKVSVKFSFVCNESFSIARAIFSGRVARAFSQVTSKVFPARVSRGTILYRTNRRRSV